MKKLSLVLMTFTFLGTATLAKADETCTHANYLGIGYCATLEKNEEQVKILNPRVISMYVEYGAGIKTGKKRLLCREFGRASNENWSYVSGSLEVGYARVRSTNNNRQDFISDKGMKVIYSITCKRN